MTQRSLSILVCTCLLLSCTRKTEPVKPEYQVCKEWKAVWITSDGSESLSMPLFKKDFKVEKHLTRAMIFVSGLGYNEVYLNGKKVGDHVLDPAQTNYDAYALYSAYEVTDQIRQGVNRIGVMLGDGWYNQNKAFGIDLGYGKPLLICQIELEYKDKSLAVEVSDTTWECAGGPVISANVYAGETYDARKEVEGWSIAGSNNGQWKRVVAARTFPPELKPQMLPPIKKMKELAVKRFYRQANGKTIFDLGQNFAGWARITVKEPAGTVLSMRMSEEVYPDGSLDFTSTGVFATQFVQTDTYTCKGTGTEIWEPRFTYHGFRYVEVSGLSTLPNQETIKGIVVYSSVDTVGSFRCSDEQINRLHEMALWTLTSNIQGFPSDCPHREKCGWLGDAHAIAPMSIYNFDMESFWIKYLNDIRSSAARQGVTIHHQAKNSVFYQAYKKPGIPYMIAPGKRECGAASPDWGTALVQIPWYLYLYYGNSEILREFYPDMKIWVDYVDSLSVQNIVNQGLGDWCPPGGVDSIDCPYQLSSTAYHYLDLKLMAQVSANLGISIDEKRYGERMIEVKEAFISKFYDPLKKSFGSQTANAMALDLGLAPAGDELAVSNAIVQDVKEKYSGFHHTGIFGLPRIFDALARYGNEETAMSILAGKGKKSFENMWKIYDATTLWEELPVDDVPDAANLRSKFGSHNHPMQGGFDAWFYKGIAGISPVPENPGFRTIRFEPMLVNQLKWAEGSYCSKYGMIRSSWKWKDKLFLWKITIPADCKGEVVLPIKGFSLLTINGKASKRLEKILFLNPGTYEIETKK
jgi:alpha-L-rhamnosidase